MRKSELVTEFFQIICEERGGGVVKSRKNWAGCVWGHCSGIASGPFAMRRNRSQRSSAWTIKHAVSTPRKKVKASLTMRNGRACRQRERLLKVKVKFKVNARIGVACAKVPNRRLRTCPKTHNTTAFWHTTSNFINVRRRKKNPRVYFKLTAFIICMQTKFSKSNKKFKS